MFGNWGGTAQMLATFGSPTAWKNAKKKATLKEANRLRGLMIKAFNQGGPQGKRWKRLSVFTQLLSRAKGLGDRRPLMSSGDLRNSHSVVEEPDDVVFVGVHRTAKGKGSRGRDKAGRFTRAGEGGSLANIAAIHEHGAGPIYIRVTPAMRAFFLWLSKKTKGQTKPLRRNTIAVVVRIPARPWIAPIWEAEQDNSFANIARDTYRDLGLPGF
jgi:hypothetical protein